MKPVISLWLDRTSNHDQPVWVVSRDRAAWSDTVAIFAEDDYADALAFAKDECQRTGYPVVETDPDGAETLRYTISRPLTEP